MKKFFESNTEALATTSINYLELFFGLDLEKTSHKEEAAYYREFFDNLQTLELTKESCEKASTIYQSLKKTGKSAEPFDCTIATILSANGISKILTRNVKDFEKISNIKALSY